jgi:hypothetical protein
MPEILTCPAHCWIHVAQMEVYRTLDKVGHFSALSFLSSREPDREWIPYSGYLCTPGSMFFTNPWRIPPWNCGGYRVLWGSIAKRDLLLTYQYCGHIVYVHICTGDVMKILV